MKCRMVEHGYAEVGLKNVKLGHYSVFAHSDEEWDKLLATVGQVGIG